VFLQAPDEIDALNRFDELALSVTGGTSGRRDHTARRAALNRAAQQRGYVGLLDLMKTLEQMAQAPRDALIEEIAGSIAVKETYFFRIPGQFDTLVGPVLNEIEAMRRATSRSLIAPLHLRAWSAACSTGEEPYSMAMAILEALRFPRAWDVSILATDISSEALAIAQSAAYQQSVLRRVSTRWSSTLEGNVDARDPERARVCQRVRDLVSFERHNLLNAAPSTDFDVVFCRNVMIYFPLDSQPALIERLYRALRPAAGSFSAMRSCCM